MPSSKKLLVEGPGDQRVISALAAKLGLPLPNGPGKYLVEIKALSIPAMFESDNLRAEAQGSGLEILGIVLDADVNPERQLADLRKACIESIGVTIPESLPADGWIAPAEAGKLRFGVWMMPDNSAKGMLETFLTWFRHREISSGPGRRSFASKRGKGGLPSRRSIGTRPGSTPISPFRMSRVANSTKPSSIGFSILNTLWPGSFLAGSASFFK